MRNYVIAAVLAVASFGVVAASEAGGRKNDWVCWTGRDGASDCADLPEPYRVRDTPGKPHWHEDGRRCKHCALDFRLSHRNIDDFGGYVDTRNMRPYHGATLYGDKYRGIRD